jgi:formate-dependent nitrite reductase membrane component NrfD
VADTTPTYYGLPAVKRSHYGWLIATYFFVGGLAGAAQVIAQIADLVSDDRAVVRAGRYLALLGSLLSPLLLISDLHTSSRWFNMLRIFRPTSPMSIGSWTLAGFGTFSGLAALAEAVGLRRLASLLGLPAAGLGMLMSVYTGVLLSATSTPLWSVAYRQLPALFAATAVASASAAMSLLLARSSKPPRPALERLDLLGLVAGLVQLAATWSLERAWKAKQLDPPLAPAQRLAVQGLGIGLPLLVQAFQILTGRRRTGLSILAAACTLNGAFLERATIVFSGNRSADRPEDYLRVAR